MSVIPVPVPNRIPKYLHEVWNKLPKESRDEWCWAIEIIPNEFRQLIHTLKIMDEVREMNRISAKVNESWDDILPVNPSGFEFDLKNIPLPIKYEGFDFGLSIASVNTDDK